MHLVCQRPRKKNNYCPIPQKVYYISFREISLSGCRVHNVPYNDYHYNYNIELIAGQLPLHDSDISSFGF